MIVGILDASMCEHRTVDRRLFVRTGVPSAHSRHAEPTVRAARHRCTRRRGNGRQWARRSRGLTTRCGSPSSSAFRPRPIDADACPPKVRRSHAVSVHVPSARIENATVAANERLSPTGQIANSIRFPFQRFHVLFNSLFKVLFTFPSRYLFAIGLAARI